MVLLSDVEVSFTLLLRTFFCLWVRDGLGCNEDVSADLDFVVLLRGEACPLLEEVEVLLVCAGDGVANAAAERRDIRGGTAP